MIITFITIVAIVIISLTIVTVTMIVKLRGLWAFRLRVLGFCAFGFRV